MASADELMDGHYCDKLNNFLGEGLKDMTGDAITADTFYRGWKHRFSGTIGK